ncbi:MAG: hypothetical protein WC851_04870 [Candidatus Shapirobacteria bacterium]|jgi:hypothetical protein
MSKKRSTAEATITFYIDEDTQFNIDTNMNSAQIAEEQGKFWTAIANMPAGRRGQTILPGEAERMEAERRQATRHTGKAYLRYK